MLLVISFASEWSRVSNEHLGANLLRMLFCPFRNGATVLSYLTAEVDMFTVIAAVTYFADQELTRVARNAPHSEDIPFQPGRARTNCPTAPPIH